MYVIVRAEICEVNGATTPHLGTYHVDQLLQGVDCRLPHFPHRRRRIIVTLLHPLFHILLPETIIGIQRA
jgi:hypothetical protein